MTDLGSTLKRLRAARELTLQNVADWFGIKKTSVYGWEELGKTPELEKLKELAKRYGVTLDSIVDGTAGVGGANETTNHSSERKASPSDIQARTAFRLDDNGTLYEEVDAVNTKLSLLPPRKDVYALLISSSEISAFRAGTALLVSKTEPLVADRLCVVTKRDATVLLAASLIEHPHAIKFERMDGSTFTLQRSDIERIELVVAIDCNVKR